MTDFVEHIRKAKELLWTGASQVDVAAELGYAQPTVSLIMNGKHGANVPWPDGSLGAMPQEQRAKFRRAGRPKKGQPSAHNRPLSEPTQGVISEAVDTTVFWEGLRSRIQDAQENPLLPPPQRQKKRKVNLDDQETFERLLQDEEAAEEEELAKKITDPNLAKPAKKKRKQSSASIAHGEYSLDWKQVLQLAPTNKYVTAAQLPDAEPEMKDAICIIFAQLPPDHWIDPNTGRLIKQIILELKRKGKG